MIDLPPKIDHGLSVLAEWAAHQPGIDAGVQVAYLLSLAARAQTPEQKQTIRSLIGGFTKQTGTLNAQSFEDLNRSICDALGWTYE